MKRDQSWTLAWNHAVQAILVCVGVLLVMPAAADRGKPRAKSGMKPPTIAGAGKPSPAMGKKTSIAKVRVKFRGRYVEAVAGEVMLRFTRSITRADRARIASSLGLAERFFIEELDLGAYTIGAGGSVEAAIAAALKAGGVTDALPSSVARFLSCDPDCQGHDGVCPVSDDILYRMGLQTPFLGLIDMDRAWSDPSIYGSRSSPDVSIWVLDSGVDTRHPDLAEKLFYNGGIPVGFTSPGLPTSLPPGLPPFTDQNGHGTAVAGVAAAATNNRDTYAIPLVITCASDGAVPSGQNRMPTMRRELAGARVGSVVYAVGGRNGVSGPLSTVEAFDVVTSTWSSKASMSIPRSQLACSELGGRIYAIGGMDGAGNALDTVEVYDPATDTWTSSIAQLPVARRGLAAASLNGKVYAIGGRDGTGVVDTVYVYDPGADTWALSVSTLSIGREALAAVALDGALYALGGDGGSGPTDLLEVFDGASWQIASQPLPTPRRWLAAMTDGTYVFAVGGEDGDGTPLGTDERFHPSSGWVTFDPITPVSRMLGVGWIDTGGGRWGVFGGTDGGGIAGTAWNARIVPMRLSSNLDGDFPAGNGTWAQLAAMTLGVGTVLTNRLGLPSHRIINMSYGIDLRDNFSEYFVPDELKFAAECERRGHIAVAAGGNEGSADPKDKPLCAQPDPSLPVPNCFDADCRHAICDSVTMPANLPQVVSVAQSQFDCAWGSLAGPEIDLVAPSAGVLTCLPLRLDGSHPPIGMYGGQKGSSVAAPMVAGVAACLVDQNPDWFGETVRRRLKQTAHKAVCGPERPCGTCTYEEENGAGRLDAYAALGGPPGGSGCLSPPYRWLYLSDSRSIVSAHHGDDTYNYRRHLSASNLGSVATFQVTVANPAKATDPSYDVSCGSFRVGVTKPDGANVAVSGCPEMPIFFGTSATVSTWSIGTYTADANYSFKEKFHTATVFVMDPANPSIEYAIPAPAIVVAGDAPANITAEVITPNPNACDPITIRVRVWDADGHLITEAPVNGLVWEAPVPQTGDPTAVFADTTLTASAGETGIANPWCDFIIRPSAKSGSHGIIFSVAYPYTWVTTLLTLTTVPCGPDHVVIDTQYEAIVPGLTEEVRAHAEDIWGNRITDSAVVNITTLCLEMLTSNGGSYVSSEVIGADGIARRLYRAGALGACDTLEASLWNVACGNGLVGKASVPICPREPVVVRVRQVPDHVPAGGPVHLLIDPLSGDDPPLVVAGVAVEASLVSVPLGATGAGLTDLYATNPPAGLMGAISGAPLDTTVVVHTGDKVGDHIVNVSLPAYPGVASVAATVRATRDWLAWRRDQSQNPCAIGEVLRPPLKQLWAANAMGGRPAMLAIPSMSPLMDREIIFAPYLDEVAAISPVDGSLVGSGQFPGNLPMAWLGPTIAQVSGNESVWVPMPSGLARMDFTSPSGPFALGPSAGTYHPGSAYAIVAEGPRVVEVNCASEGWIAAYDERWSSLAETWKLSLPLQIVWGSWALPAVGYGRVYLPFGASGQARLGAFDIRTGAMRSDGSWPVDLGMKGMLAPPTLTRDHQSGQLKVLLYYQDPYTEEDGIACIDGKTGSRLWGTDFAHSPTIGGIGGGPPLAAFRNLVVADGRVFFTYENRVLPWETDPGPGAEYHQWVISASLEDGSLDRTFHIALSGHAHAMAAANGYLYVMNPDLAIPGNRLQIYRWDTGALVEEHQFGTSAAMMLGVSIANSMVFAQSQDGTVYAWGASVHCPGNVRGTPQGNSILVQWDAPAESTWPIDHYVLYRLDVPTGSFIEIGQVPAATPEFLDEGILSGVTGCQSWSYRVTAVDVNGNVSENCQAAEVTYGGDIKWSWNYRAIATGGTAELSLDVSYLDGTPAADSPVELSSLDGSLTVDGITGSAVSGTTDSTGHLIARYTAGSVAGIHSVGISAACATASAEIMVVDRSTLTLADMRFDDPANSYCPPVPGSLYEGLNVPVKRALPIDAYLVGTHGGILYPIGGETITFAVSSKPVDSLDAEAPGPAVTNTFGNAHAYGFKPGIVYGGYKVDMSHPDAGTRTISIRAVGEMPQFGGDPGHSGTKDYERLLPPLRLLWARGTAGNSPFFGSITVAVGVMEATEGSNCREPVILGANGVGVVSLDDTGVEFTNKWTTGLWVADQYQTLAVGLYERDRWPEYLPIPLARVPPGPEPCWESPGCHSPFLQTGAFAGEAFTGFYVDPTGARAGTGHGHGSPAVFEPHANPGFVLGTKADLPTLAASPSSRAVVAPFDGGLVMTFAAEGIAVTTPVFPLYFQEPYTSLRIDSTPAVGSLGYAYVADATGKVWAVDLAASMVAAQNPASPPVASIAWTYQTGPRSTPSPTWNSSPAVARNWGGREVVYVGSDDGNLYALDAKTGGPMWRFPVFRGLPVRSSPAVCTFDGVTYVVVGANIGQVYAIRDPDWPPLAPSTPPSSVPTVPSTWTFSPRHPVESSPTITPPHGAAGPGFVYIGSDDGNLYVLELTTGKLVDTKRTKGKIKGRPAVANGRVYIGSADGMIYAYGAGVGCPARLRQVAADSGIAIEWNPPYPGSVAPVLYRVSRSETPDEPFTEIGQVPAAGPLTWSDVPPHGGTWLYRVIAEDAQLNRSEDCSDLTATCGGSLQVVGLTVDPPAPCSGDTFRIRLEVLNPGPGSVGNVTGVCSVAGLATEIEPKPAAVVTLAGNKRHVFEWRYEATGAGLLVIAASAEGTDSCSGTLVRSPESKVNTQANDPDITVTVTGPSDVQRVGDTFAFTVSIKNTGQVDASNVAVSLSMTPASIWVKRKAPFVPLVVTSLPVGASHSWTVNYSSTGPGVFTFYGKAIARMCSEGRQFESDGFPVTIGRAALSLLSVTPSPSAVCPGSVGSISLDCVIRNTGDGHASDVTVVPSPVPPGGASAAVIPAPVDLYAGWDKTITVTWTAGTSPGDVKFDVTAQGVDVNSKGILTAGPLTSGPVRISDRSMLVSMDLVGSIVVGNTIQVVISVENTSGLAATGVATQLQTESGSPPVTLTPPTDNSRVIAAGATATFIWLCRLDQGGILVLDGRATGDICGAVDYPGTSKTLRYGRADIEALSLTTDKSVVCPGDSFNLILTVRNAGTAPATSIRGGTVGVAGTSAADVGPSTMISSLAPGDTGTITWPCQSRMPLGSLELTAGATGIDLVSGDIITSDVLAASSVLVNFGVVATLSVPDPVMVGEAFPVTVDIRNDSTGSAKVTPGAMDLAMNWGKAEQISGPAGTIELLPGDSSTFTWTFVTHAMGQVQFLPNLDVDACLSGSLNAGARLTTSYWGKGDWPMWGHDAQHSFRQTGTSPFLLPPLEEVWRVPSASGPIVVGNLSYWLEGGVSPLASCNVGTFNHLLARRVVDGSPVWCAAGVFFPAAMACNGNMLYVVNWENGQAVDAYDALSGHLYGRRPVRDGVTNITIDNGIMYAVSPNGLSIFPSTADPVLSFHATDFAGVNTLLDAPPLVVNGAMILIGINSMGGQPRLIRVGPLASSPSWNVPLDVLPQYGPNADFLSFDGTSIIVTGMTTRTAVEAFNPTDGNRVRSCTWDNAAQAYGPVLATDGDVVVRRTLGSMGLQGVQYNPSISVKLRPYGTGFSVMGESEPLWWGGFGLLAGRSAVANGFVYHEAMNLAQVLPGGSNSHPAIFHTVRLDDSQVVWAPTTAHSPVMWSAPAIAKGLLFADGGHVYGPRTIDPPKDFSVVGVPGGAELAWSPPVLGASNVASYQVYRAEMGKGQIWAGAFENPAVSPAPVLVTTTEELAFSDSGLAPGKRYWYAVRAATKSGVPQASWFTPEQSAVVGGIVVSISSPKSCLVLYDSLSLRVSGRAYYLGYPSRFQRYELWLDGTKVVTSTIQKGDEYTDTDLGWVTFPFGDTKGCHTITLIAYDSDGHEASTSVTVARRLNSGCGGCPESGAVLTFSEHRHPEGIATDERDFVYVVDSLRHRVERFDAEGRLLWEIGIPGASGKDPEGLQDPIAATIAEDGTLFIADRLRRQVVVYDEDGQFRYTIGGPGDGQGQFQEPSGIGLDPAGQLWVADRVSGRLQEFTLDGTPLRTAGQVAEGLSNLKQPAHVWVEASGTVWVADAGNNRVCAFDREGRFLRAVGTAGNGSVDLKGPSGVAVDSEARRVFVSDSGDDRVKVFDADAGGMLFSLGEPGTAVGQLRQPGGLALDSQAAYLYVADTLNNRGQRWPLRLSDPSDTIRPRAELTALSSASAERGAVLEVRGRAVDAHFSRYRLVLTGTAGSSSVLVESHLPTWLGVLGEVNTAGFEPGGYWLELLVEDRAGNIGKDSRFLSILPRSIPIASASEHAEMAR